MVQVCVRDRVRESEGGREGGKEREGDRGRERERACVRERVQVCMLPPSSGHAPMQQILDPALF